MQVGSVEILGDLLISNKIFVAFSLGDSGTDRSNANGIVSQSSDLV